MNVTNNNIPGVEFIGQDQEVETDNVTGKIRFALKYLIFYYFPPQITPMLKSFCSRSGCYRRRLENTRSPMWLMKTTATLLSSAYC